MPGEALCGIMSPGDLVERTSPSFWKAQLEEFAFKPPRHVCGVLQVGFTPLSDAAPVEYGPVLLLADLGGVYTAP